MLVRDYKRITAATCCCVRCQLCAEGTGSLGLTVTYSGTHTCEDNVECFDLLEDSSCHLTFVGTGYDGDTPINCEWSPVEADACPSTQSLYLEYVGENLRWRLAVANLGEFTWSGDCDFVPSFEDITFTPFFYSPCEENLPTCIEDITVSLAWD